MKSILFYLAVLTLSFNVFACEIQGKPKITTTDRTSTFLTIALNQENPQDAHLPNDVANNHIIPQALAEKPSEFLTALSVYLIIIIVYSFYGFKAKSKNVRN